MNEIAERKFSVPANIADMTQSLANSANAASAGDGSVYMRFNRAGLWQFGPEQIEPEEDSLWAINPSAFKHGWVAWGSKEYGNAGKKLGDRMVSATEPLPSRGELPNVDGDWSQAVEMTLQCISGEDEGVSVVYNANSAGGRNCYAKIVQEVINQVSKNPDFFVPVVTLSNGSYKHDSYGTIYTPKMTVVKWLDMNGNEPAVAAVEKAASKSVFDDSEGAGEDQAPEESTRRRRRTR